MDTLDIEIQCPVKTRVLGVMRTFVASVAEQMGFDENSRDEIEMAVDEACANVIRHAYKHMGVSPDLTDAVSESSALAESCNFRMHISFGDNALEISIIDHGIGVEKTPPGVNSIAEFESRGGRGGLGIFIIRSFMDEVYYENSDDAGTKLVMKKFLRSEGNVRP